MFFIRVLLANILGLWLSDYLLGGFSVGHSWKGLLVAGLVLAILNILLKPILKLVSLPVIIATLGIFTIIINCFILWLASKIVPGYIYIGSLTALLFATLIIAAFNIVLRGKA